MAMVPAICTQCGAKLLVDNSKDATICEYCGTPFITEKAINSYICDTINIENATINIKTRELLDRNVTISWRYTKKENQWPYCSFTQGEVYVDDSVYASLKEGATASFKIDSSKPHRIYFKANYTRPYGSATGAINLAKPGTSEEKVSNVRQIQSGSDPLFFSIESLHFAELTISEESADPSNSVGTQHVQACYVATAVYGSYDCPEVWTLRRYRDCTLAETWYGRAFIRTYYAISPTLVKWFGKTHWFKNMWKPKLDRLVKRLNREGIADTPYQDRQW